MDSILSILLMAAGSMCAVIGSCIILKEWKGSDRKTVTLLVIGILVLVLSTFVIKL